MRGASSCLTGFPAEAEGKQTRQGHVWGLRGWELSQSSATGSFHLAPAFLLRLRQRLTGLPLVHHLAEGGVIPAGVWTLCAGQERRALGRGLLSPTQAIP